MNQDAADHDLKTVLDRIDLALARIEGTRSRRAERENARLAYALAAPQDHSELPHREIHVMAPEWASDVADRLDALIGELRRALSGEQN